MISLSAVFWLFVVLFGIIGGFRGWAKELLVIFSMVLALFIQHLLDHYVSGVHQAIQAQDPGTQVLIRAGLMLLLAYFGYQTPGLPGTLSAKLLRDKMQDWMLGAVLGAINGYFIMGSIWYYIDQAGYPFTYITPPADPSVLEMLAFMPPKLLGEPYIFFAIGAAFVFVIIVFV